MKKFTIFALFLTALMSSIALQACEEESPNCPNPPYRFDNEVDRCRDGDGQFAVNECCD